MVLGTMGPKLSVGHLKIFVDKNYSSSSFSIKLLVLKIVPGIFQLKPHTNKMHKVYSNVFL